MRNPSWNVGHLVGLEPPEQPRPAPVSGDWISREAAIEAVMRGLNASEQYDALRALPSVSVTEEQIDGIVQKLAERKRCCEPCDKDLCSCREDVDVVIAALGRDVK